MQRQSTNIPWQVHSPICHKGIGPGMLWFVFRSSSDSGSKKAKKKKSKKKKKNKKEKKGKKP